MPVLLETRAATVKIALAGNPNAGKTSLFNALTGAHHKVGNYPGVTIEKREGERRRDGRTYRFVDLPGIYSLTAYSLDEVVTRDCLLDEPPDLIIDVLDSTNLERHLFLCLQFQELGIPVIGALNMSDEAKARGIEIDERGLGRLLGIPVTSTIATSGQGIDGLLDLVDESLARLGTDTRRLDYGSEIEALIAPLERAIEANSSFAEKYPSRWLAVKLIEKDENAFERLAEHPEADSIRALARRASEWIGRHFGKDAEIVISEQRYAYIHGACSESVRRKFRPAPTPSERIDGIVMHPLLSLPIFALVLWGIFELTFSVGKWPMAWIETFFRWLSSLAAAFLPAGPLHSLVIDGVLAGVGSVLSFVPLIIILFFLLSVLEDTGYLSRAAFATDRLLHGFGLHGQSIFPLMLGFGCSVPAIMAARTLKSPRDRILTVLVIPFMSCGAKLPVHVLFAAAFFPKNPALAVMVVYAAGAIVALAAALVLRRTILKGEPTPFVMELPPWRAPTLRGLLWHVGEKTTTYAKKAGTVILAASILIWAITSFPAYSPKAGEREALAAAWSGAHPGASQAAIDAALSTELAARGLSGSIAGSFGHLVEPLIRPLGLDWKVGVATVTGFAAKEVVVSTLGILYGVGSDQGGSASLRERIAADPSWSPLTAITLMLFILLIPPCFAAMATMRAELGWGWLAFSIGFQLAVGWLAGFAVFQIGSALGFA
ncbi:MAG TPA: ferrous iron transport protein B [Rectinemataceae bacterium]|nr:ferrous iron transport protein B [Rectinemataceae bacterium]